MSRVLCNFIYNTIVTYFHTNLKALELLEVHNIHSSPCIIGSILVRAWFGVNLCSSSSVGCGDGGSGCEIEHEKYILAVTYLLIFR